MSQPDGPRVGAVGVNGWDTHYNEGAVGGQLASMLGVLDDGVAAFEKEMGDAWRETVVVIITEFGRTGSGAGDSGKSHYISSS